MSPVDISCMWFDKGYYCVNLVGGSVIAKSINKILIWAGSDVTYLGGGESSLYNTDLYCVQSEKDDLLCSKNLHEISLMERGIKVKKRFGYTEDDIRHYTAYRGL